MDTRDVDTLMHVIRHSSFAAAARVMNVDPSSVSRSIAALEAELGTRLFLRDSRHLVLTEAGIAFSERVGLAMEELAQAHSAAIDAVGAVQGRLRVTTSSAFATRRLAPLMQAFCEAHPALELDLLLSEVPMDLTAERIDVAIRLGTLADSSLVAIPLLDLRYHVVASPAWVRQQATPPRDPRDLEAFRCLCFAPLGTQDSWQFTPIDGGKMTELAVRPRVVANNALVLREYALGGLGPALLADWMVDDDLASGSLVNLFPNHAVRRANAPSTAWAIYPSRAYVPAKVRVFIEFLREAMNSHADLPTP